MYRCPAEFSRVKNSICSMCVRVPVTTSSFSKCQILSVRLELWRPLDPGGAFTSVTASHHTLAESVRESVCVCVCVFMVNVLVFCPLVMNDNTKCPLFSVRIWVRLIFSVTSQQHLPSSLALPLCNNLSLSLSVSLYHTCIMSFSFYHPHTQLTLG